MKMFGNFRSDDAEMALPFVLHMLGVYYAMLVTTYVSNDDDDDIMCSVRRPGMR